MMWLQTSVEPPGISLPVPSWVRCTDDGLTADLGAGGTWMFRALVFSLAPLMALPPFWFVAARVPPEAVVAILGRSTVVVRDRALSISCSVLGVQFFTRTIPASEIHSIAGHRIELVGGSVHTLYSAHDPAEIAALCDLIHHALVGESPSLPAHLLPWGEPPRGIPHLAGPLPQWAITTHHAGSAIFTVPRRRLLGAGYAALFLAGLSPYVFVLVLCLVMSGMSSVVAVGFVVGFCFLLLGTLFGGIVGLAGIFDEHLVQIDGENIYIVRRLVGVARHRDTLPLRNVRAIRSNGELLLFFLPDRLVSVHCSSPYDEVAAFAFHLDRLAISASLRTDEPPPEEVLALVSMPHEGKQDPG